MISAMRRQKRKGKGIWPISVSYTHLMGLARALYGNPRILLLDEFTAHVDTKTEWMLYQTLAKMKGQYTCIVISHRHMNMDNIHVLEL